MGLFGKKPVKGISEYELTQHGNRLKNRLDAVFSGHSKNIREQKRAILDNALGLANDRDPNMPLSQKHGIIQPDEFESIVGGLEKNKIVSKQEAERLRDAAHDALSN